MSKVFKGSKGIGAMFGSVKSLEELIKEKMPTTTQNIADLIKMGLLAITQEIKTATKEEIEEALEELIKEKMPAGMFTGVKAELEENIVHVTIQMHTHAEKFEVETNMLLTDVVRIDHDPDFMKDLKDL